jgi:ATP-dependent Clp protease, protease subunit
MPDLAGLKIAYIGYCGLIDSSGVTRICGALNTAVNNQFDGVYLCLSSNGGYVGDGIFLYNHIRSLPIQITIHNTGTVASIATTLFVAGHRRLCAPHSIFMMHPVAVGGSGPMASAPLQAALDSALRDEERTENILQSELTFPKMSLSLGEVVTSTCPPKTPWDMVLLTRSPNSRSRPAIKFSKSDGGGS